MHLLRREANGEFSLAEYYGQPPPYAILSHTWGSDSDEVTFKDIVKGRGKDKPGYKKLRFCAAKAAREGLEYFWIDTCCIDKRDSVKLSEAINSMYSWYQRSARCYVYLTDVDVSSALRNALNESEASTLKGWRSSFKKSKWFTRGWTLQELLAPSSVHFFDFNGIWMGNRTILSEEIQEATTIPLQVLRESSLSPSSYSIEERMSWAAGRQTKREEDQAYSLLGLFGVHMPPIYGEGRSNAFVRLRWEIKRKQETAQRTEVVAANEDLEDLSSDAETEETMVLEPPDSKSSEVDDWYQHRSPIDSIAQHNTKEMERQWNEAIAGNVNTTGSYEKVAVLLVRWADELDELRTRDEVEELEHVFRDRFSFYTSKVTLNIRSKPQHQMDRSLITFIEQNDGPRNLLIVYYTGHGIYNERQKCLELSAVMNSSHAKINWHRSEDTLRGSSDVDADVLTILDALYASDQLIDRMAGDDAWDGDKQKRRFELMSACGVGGTTAAPGPYSFTRALIDALTAFVDQGPDDSFSTFSLNQRICMSPGRRDTTSMLWSLLPNKSHIFLTPMRKASDVMADRQQKGKAYLRLGLGLRDETLSKTQIENLVQALAKLTRNEHIGLRSIDWLGFESKHGYITQFVRVVNVIVLAKRWRLLVRRRNLRCEDLACLGEWKNVEEESYDDPSPTRAIHNFRNPHIATFKESFERGTSRSQELEEEFVRRQEELD